MSAVDPITEISRRLRDHPVLELEEGPGSIEARPAGDGGFPVALFVERDGYTVYFAGWQERFASPRDALNCFLYGLFGECRLRVTYRGATAHRWTLEEQRGGRWIEESTTGQYIFPFWRRPRTGFLENRLERNAT